ncbi:MAG: YlxR family protein [Microbacteriaceae bacterium]
MNPVRTCIGCRTRDDRASLVRVVLAGSTVVVDPTATAPGRGAWVHPTADCVNNAVSRGGFARSFRRSAAFDAGGLLAHITT